MINFFDDVTEEEEEASLMDRRRRFQQAYRIAMETDTQVSKIIPIYSFFNFLPFISLSRAMLIPLEKVFPSLEVHANCQLSAGQHL